MLDTHDEQANLFDRIALQMLVLSGNLYHFHVIVEQSVITNSFRRPPYSAYQTLIYIYCKNFIYFVFEKKSTQNMPSVCGGKVLTCSQIHEFAF